jgi:hypothetical protein
MAIYILIDKESENAESVIYRFSPDKINWGRLQLYKNTGNIDELEQIPNQAQNSTLNKKQLGKLRVNENNGEVDTSHSVTSSSRDFTRVAVKLYRYWQKKEFPDKTCFAA